VLRDAIHWLNRGSVGFCSRKLFDDLGCWLGLGFQWRNGGGRSEGFFVLIDLPALCLQKSARHRGASVGCPGNPHTPILNKYCVVRPQFLLNTNEYQKQAGRLTESDLGAVWEMLSSLGSGKGKNGYFVIYNCRVQGGGSVGHKHLQIWRRLEGDEFKAFPDVLGISSGKSL